MYTRPTVLAVLTLLAACVPSVAPDPGHGPPPAPFTLALQGDTARAVLPLQGGALVFQEPIGGGLVEADVRRTLTWLDATGARVAEVRAGPQELFLDVVTHPSGEATLFVKSGATCGLRRYGPAGALLADTVVTDLDLETDPTFTEWDPAIPWDVGGCQPREIRETARLAADGEHVYLVNRGGSSGIVLFRYDWAPGGFTRTLRKPLFPRHGALLPAGIIASHRVLRSTHWSYVPRMTVDDAGRARVLLVFGSGTQTEVYNAFAKVPVSDTARGVLLTLTPRGELVEARELSRDLVLPRSVTDYEGLRWLRGGVVLTGRTAPAPLPEDGFGWDGFVLHLVDGEPEPRLRARVDLDRGAVLSDVAAHGDTGWLVAGRSGYWQNPHGASISEEGRAEFVLLDATGAITRRMELPHGPRHNAALSLAPDTEHPGVYVVGGLTNGPGSHSADADPALLQSDGWVTQLTVE